MVQRLSLPVLCPSGVSDPIAHPLSLCPRSDAFAPEWGQKKFRKKAKKVLTNGGRCAIIIHVPRDTKENKEMDD